MARNEGKSTPGIRIRHRLSSKWTTKAAREQKTRAICRLIKNEDLGVNRPQESEFDIG
jgi:hypothetical protein